MPHDHPGHAEDLLADLLCEALDSAAEDPLRIALMTRLFLLSADADRADDLDRIRRDGFPPVYRS